MARIRTIKPDFWGDSKTARCSRDARLLFLGLLNESDDAGRQLGNARKVAGSVFPNDDDVSPKMVDKWLTELERERFIVRYAVDNVQYVAIVGFTKHQKISHPTPSRLPAPSDMLLRTSGIPPETLPNVSGSDLGKGSRNKDLGSGSQNSSSDALHAGTEPPVDNDEDEDDPRYCAVLESRIRKRINGRTDIRDPKAYRATILGDLLPDATRTRQLLADFPTAPAQSIAGHLDGEPSTLARYRPQEQTA